MINIPPIRTRRITAYMRELPIGPAIRLASIHPKRHEYATTEFLRVVIESAETPTPTHVSDPRLWTVQERTLAVCHYMAMAVDGEPDFKVGEHGRLTDYMRTELDYPGPVMLGEACSDQWQMIPMTGMAAESIERLEGEVPGIPAGRPHWLFGSMAAQLMRLNAEEQPPIDDVAFDEWMTARMLVFANFPQSDIAELANLRAIGAAKLMHLFDCDIGLDGMVALPKEEEGEGKGLPPARFPVDRCNGRLAKELAESLEKPAQ